MKKTVNIKGDYVEGKSIGTVIHNVETGGIGIEINNEPNNAPENEELDLCKLLKGHERETFYSPICGKVKIDGITEYGVIVMDMTKTYFHFNRHGIYSDGGEVLLFPSEDQHDWFLWAEQRKAKRWRADKLETYYYVNEKIGCTQSPDCYYSLDHEMYRNFNYFRTEQQAEEAARRVKEVLRNYHEEIGE